MTKIKICGIYRDKDADFINAYRPDYFGMVIDFPKSHRNVNVETADHLRNLIADDIPAVGVFVNSPISQVEKLLREGIINIAQLHGNEDERYIDELKVKGFEVWKAFKIRGTEDIENAEKSNANLILLDNGYGTGETFDWNLIKNFKRRFALAGGLRADNIAQAAEKYSPYLLDISSGVETNGVKDGNKIKECIEAVRSLAK